MDYQPLSSAPRDGTHVSLLTSDFGAVEGWWDVNVPNFYKSQEGWASYDPENAQGDWVSEWQIGDGRDEYGRLYCGATPQAWAPLPVKRCGICRDWARDDGGWCRNMFGRAFGCTMNEGDACPNLQ